MSWMQVFAGLALMLFMWGTGFLTGIAFMLQGTPR